MRTKPGRPEECAQPAERRQRGLGAATVPGKGLAGPAPRRRMLVCILCGGPRSIPESMESPATRFPPSTRPGWRVGHCAGPDQRRRADQRRRPERCEWPSGLMNPYRDFNRCNRRRALDYSVFVYRGSFRMNQAAALSRAQHAYELLAAHKPEDALALQKKLLRLIRKRSPADGLGRCRSCAGPQGRSQASVAGSHRLSKAPGADAQVSYIPDLEAKLKRL